jgi:hypothetical protein
VGSLTRILSLGLSVALVSCAPPGDEIIVLARDGDGRFSLEPRVLDVESLDPLVSEHFTLVEGASLRQVGDTIVVEGGSPFAARLTGDAPRAPLDHECLVALTAIQHFEDAHAFFVRMGVGDAGVAPERSRIFLYPRLLGDGLSISTFSDNAGFASEIDGFILAPEVQLGDADVPLATSPLIATHELGHAMIHRLARRGPVDDPHYASLHEGLSDVFAVAQHDAPDVLADIGEHELFAAGARDVRIERALTPAQLDALRSGSRRSPYPVGTLIARTFWLAAERTLETHGSRHAALEHVASLAVAALASFPSDAPLHILPFFDHLLRLPSVDATHHAAFCDSLRETFAIAIDESEECR